MPRVDINFNKKQTKKVENLVIHDVYVLDASGSMGIPNNPITKAGKAISGCIENLKSSFANKDAKTLATVCVFDYYINFPHTLNTKLPTEKSIRNVWEQNTTALFDAIGKTIVMLEEQVKDGERVAIKIFTDGRENASRKYKSHHIQTMIKDCEAKGWTIAFIGTDRDVDHVQSLLDIKESNSLRYDGTAKGFEKTMVTTREAMASYTDKASRGEDTTFGFYKGISK